MRLGRGAQVGWDKGAGLVPAAAEASGHPTMRVLFTRA